MRSSTVPSAEQPANNAPPGVGFLNTQEAARYLSLSIKDLERMRREGRGPRFAKLSRKVVRYGIDDLRAWVEAHVVSNTAEGRALLRAGGAVR